MGPPSPLGAHGDTPKVWVAAVCVVGTWAVGRMGTAAFAVFIDEFCLRVPVWVGLRSIVESYKQVAEGYVKCPRVCKKNSQKIGYLFWSRVQKTFS